MSEHSPLTLSNAKLAALAEGLASLDGLRVKPGEFEPFLFNPETTWTIAHNQTVVGDKLKAFNQAKKLLATQHKVADGMSITTENAVAVAAFMSGLDELLERAVEVGGVVKISRESLHVGHKKEQNKIPPSVLAKLTPVFED